jgi:hypothetical protein
MNTVSIARYVLLLDVATKRPGCAILQSLAGITYRDLEGPFYLFDVETWVTSPSPNMARVEGTLQDWKKVAEQVNALYGGIKG